jgi:hypothetical protein
MRGPDSDTEPDPEKMSESPNHWWIPDMSMIDVVMRVDVGHELHVVLVLLVKLQLVVVAKVVAQWHQHHVMRVQAAYKT